MKSIIANRNSPVRLVIDVTNSMRSQLGTGIQRVAAKFAENLINSDEESIVVIYDYKNSSYVDITETFLVLCANSHNESPHGRNSKFPMIHKSILILYMFFKKFEIVEPLIRGIKNFFLGKNGYDSLLASGKKFTIKLGDKYFTADVFWNEESDIARILELQELGCEIHVFVHDLLPITHPDFFERSAVKKFVFGISSVLPRATGLYCASKRTQAELREQVSNCPRITTINLGSDFLPNQEGVVKRIQNRIVMVGSIEPRKNYDLVIDWFSSDFHPYELHIVGRQAWKSYKIVRRLNRLTKGSSSFFWHSNLTDNELRSLLQSSEIGICASFDEGYGLPLREFAQFGLKVAASDIEIFKENFIGVVEYFDPLIVDSLDSAIERLKAKSQPKNAPGYPWKDSTKTLLDGIRASNGTQHE